MNATAYEGHTALFSAASNGHTVVVRMLLDAGARLDIRDNEGWTALHNASTMAGVDLVETVQELIGRGADMLATDAAGDTPFAFAYRDDQIYGGHLARTAAIVQYYLTHYATTVFQREGDFSLHSILRAAAYSFTERPNVLEPFAPPARARPPALSLHVTLPLGKLSTEHMRTLIDLFQSFDANLIHSRNHGNAGSSPFHTACRTETPVEILRILLQHGGVNMLAVPDLEGALPLHVLCESNPSVEAVTYLLQSYRTAVTTRTRDGALPFVVASLADATPDVLPRSSRRHSSILVDYTGYSSWITITSTTTTVSRKHTIRTIIKTKPSIECWNPMTRATMYIMRLQVRTMLHVRTTKRYRATNIGYSASRLTFTKLLCSIGPRQRLAAAILCTVVQSVF